MFIFSVLYSTLLHLPPLRFHCIGGCWDRNQDSCVFGIVRRSNHSVRSHPSAKLMKLESVRAYLTILCKEYVSVHIGEISGVIFPNFQKPAVYIQSLINVQLNILSPSAPTPLESPDQELKKFTFIYCTSTIKPNHRNITSAIQKIELSALLLFILYSL